MAPTKHQASFFVILDSRLSETGQWLSLRKRRHLSCWQTGSWTTQEAYTHHPSLEQSCKSTASHQTTRSGLECRLDSTCWLDPPKSNRQTRSDTRGSVASTARPSLLRTLSILARAYRASQSLPCIIVWYPFGNLEQSFHLSRPNESSCPRPHRACSPTREDIG